MIYCFDLDGTICSITEKNNYSLAVPFDDMIETINKLYKDNYIKIFTARGASSGIDWSEITKAQLDAWKLNYHELIMNKKPSYDCFIDDKAYNAVEWRKTNTNLIKGIIAGCFDVIHPGYIKMFKEAKKYCNHLTIALHEDPSIDRKNKLKPILSVEERKEILSSITFIDDIKSYKTEEQLEEMLKYNKFDVRVLGDDYKNKKITGADIVKRTYYVDRSHGWSTTKYKNLIKDSI